VLCKLQILKEQIVLSCITVYSYYEKNRGSSMSSRKEDINAEKEEEDLKVPHPRHP
jgi:hypothetical protein